MPVGMGAAGACVCLCRRDRNIYCCLYKLTTWGICRIPKFEFASYPKWYIWRHSLELSWRWDVALGSGRAWTRGQWTEEWPQLGEKVLRGCGRRKADFSMCQWTRWKGREVEGAKAKKEVWCKTQGMCSAKAHIQACPQCLGWSRLYVHTSAHTLCLEDEEGKNPVLL